MSKETLVTATVSVSFVTVTVQVAVLLPCFVVAVIVASPAPIAVTVPSEETVATVSSLEDHVTVLSVALSGETVAVNTAVWSFSKVNEVLSKETLVTATVSVSFVTVTVQVAVLLPSFVVTVMVALPSLTALTVPVEETVAIVSSLEDHVTVLSVAFSGVMVADSVAD